jgi:Pyruvate/2-oxoacid:ferredoxin oxidoreductase delta subunit
MDYLKIFIPFSGAVIAWFANEWRKRSWEEYQRKEDRYQELIKSLKGFHTSSWSSDKSKEYKINFIDQLNLCWMYCPDEVIKKAYTFIDAVHTDQVSSDEVKQKALGEFILAIRKDLISRKVLSKTILKQEDFRSLTST